MPLIEDTIFGTVDRERQAIERLVEFEPDEGYFLAFSGGKDSVVVKHLMDQARVKYEAVHHLTTIDAPELIHFIRRHHEDVRIDRPKHSMWALIRRFGFLPNRHTRYCCDRLKETPKGQAGRRIVTGVRAAESSARSKRRMIETCHRRANRTFLHPILDWPNDAVWEYVGKYGLPMVCMYAEGFARVGCIGCPITNAEDRLRGLDRWPKIKGAYMRAIEFIVKDRPEKYVGRTADDVWREWLYEPAHVGRDQIGLFEGE